MGKERLTNARTPRRRPMKATTSLVEELGTRIAGQPTAIEAIAPYVNLYNSGLHPEGRPAGVFLLLGPTGTGKTRTVEALADVLHGSDQHLVRIDCGEFQLEHEVAKLIGAPPGYLGHRETHPILTQQKVNAAASERSGLTLILFDEIEKAAPSMQRLLLGVLDKATLRLGDNSIVNFEHCLIFLTSNLGARTMVEQFAPSFGLSRGQSFSEPNAEQMERIAVSAVKKHFSPEFVNRIDQVIAYQPLGQFAIAQILHQQLLGVQRHLNYRLGIRSFHLSVSDGARRFLLERGIHPEYGARGLKRTIHKHLLQPLAALVASDQVTPGALVRVEPDGDTLRFEELSEAA